jgi:hypothetical protein
MPVPIIDPVIEEPNNTLLTAEIIGQSSVAPGRSFSLNAVREISSDWSPTEVVSYIWSCSRDGEVVSSTGGCGALKLGDSAVHLVPGGSLEPGQYTFAVDISQGGREARASLTVVINAPPEGGAITPNCIGIACAYPDRSVNPRQALELQLDAPVGVLVEENEVRWSWSLTGFAIEDYLVNRVDGGWRVSISTEGLQLAASHTFLATIIDKGSAETVVTLERTVRVDTPPECEDSDRACFQVRSV